MNPEKNTTATMNTTPATMPTTAAACVTRLGWRSFGTTTVSLRVSS